ncbi:MAG: gliding motility-associated protein GldE [Bacteroidales bacterium]|nr:gliding motility-associated protein GldE [Bacteroidales bacterium]
METDEAFRSLLSLNNIVVSAPDSTVLLELFVVLILLFCSAFISGSEVAFFSLSPGDKNNLENKKTKAHKRVLQLLQTPEHLLSTILVINNLVNVGIVILAAYISSQLFDFTQNPALGFILEVGVITFILLLFGEILPKVYATRENIRFVLLMAAPLQFFGKIFKPVTWLLLNLSGMFKRKGHKSSISKIELNDAITIASSENKEDEKILKGIIKFGDIEVSEIMKPRIDIVAIDIKTPFSEVMPEIIKSGYSRIPVYSESLDQVQGVLYIKDLLPHFHKPNSFSWQSLIRPPYYVPEPKKINELLEEFQTKKIHLAIVIDEYGGTSGIITLEDILEEIVGEIPDEYDNHDLQFEKISDNEYVFEGKTQLNDFFKVLEIDSDPFEDVRGESDTLAGLILEIAGEIPDKGFSVDFDNFQFKIDAADKRRIKKIHVTILNQSGNNEKS